MGSPGNSEAGRKRLERHDFLYGIYPVLSALRTGRRRFHRLWIQGVRGPKTVAPKDLEARSEIERRSRELGLKTTEACRATLDRLCDGRPHQGYVLKCKRWFPDRMSKLPEPQLGALWLALESVSDPMNLGSLLRSASFFGAAGVICEHGTARLTAVASKASAGAGEAIPMHACNDLEMLLVDARARGWTIAGTALAEPDDLAHGVASDALESWTRSMDETSKHGIVLVMGAEGAGLRLGVRRACNVLLHIPGGNSDLDSLNVNVAAGIALHSVRCALGPSGATHCASDTETADTS